MERLFMTYLLGIFSIVSLAQNPLPIIDMHLHSNAGRSSELRQNQPEAAKKVAAKANEAEDLLRMIQDKFDRHNIVMGVVIGADEEINKQWAQADERFLLGALISEGDGADFESINRDIDNGTIKIITEVAPYSNKYASNSPELDSLFAVAEAKDVPILVHSAGFGGSTNFSIQKGDPMSLCDLIGKHPQLRVYIENAAWPCGDEIISLMHANPNVYADLSSISWVIPRETFHDYLRKFVEAGLTDRLMFGSNQLMAPESIDMAIDAIHSASFLTEQQKRDIFYNNAARFLRLSEEQVRRHHSGI